MCAGALSTANGGLSLSIRSQGAQLEGGRSAPVSTPVRHRSNLGRHGSGLPQPLQKFFQENANICGAAVSLDAARLDTALDTAHSASPNALPRALGELQQCPLHCRRHYAAMQHVQAATGAEEHGSLIQGGLHWLARHANADGGWDTTKSLGNISTTTLCWATFRRAGCFRGTRRGRCRCRAMAHKAAGGVPRLSRARHYRPRQGCAFPCRSSPARWPARGAGKMSSSCRSSWPRCRERFAAHYQWWLRAALVPSANTGINIGSWNPHPRARNAAREKTLQVLEQFSRYRRVRGGHADQFCHHEFGRLRIARSSGGLKIQFLHASVRDDGSWPIDTHLATWVTTLSVNALGEDLPDDARAIREWLLKQQYREVHFTDAAPGAGLDALARLVPMPMILPARCWLSNSARSMTPRGPPRRAVVARSAKPRWRHPDLLPRLDQSARPVQPRSHRPPSPGWHGARNCPSWPTAWTLPTRCRTA